MKRTFAAVLLLLVATTMSAQERHRYAVALKHPVLAHPTPEFVGIDVEMSALDYQPLHNLQAYAADLTEAEAAALRKQPDVRYVEPAMTYHKLDLGGAPAGVDASRNLNGQTLPYGIDLVHARDAWPVVRGVGVNVAIVDTGIDYNHPDLRDNYKGGFNEINRSTDPLDDDSHGTHVAGTVAAEDNDLGVVGVAPQANVWAVKVLDNTGSGTTINIAAGLDWVIDKKKEIGGNWIVNMSLGDSHLSQILQDACQRVSDAGILIVAASGNESTPTVPAAVAYPAAFPTVIAVGAVDSTSTIADFSNQGPELAVVAPGVNVLSSVPRGAGELSFVTEGTSSFDAIHVEGSPKDTITSGFVFCSQGHVGEFPSSVSGKIALIQRGDITFNEKAKNAKAAGAIAVVIFNNDKPYSPFTFIGDDPTDKTFAWPLAVGITAEDGAAIKANPNASITIAYKNDDYAIFSGTSMATPHVVGVAALIWSAAPNATAAQVRLALTSSAHDLGATGVDVVYGSGLVSALDAGKALAPEKFGSSTQPSPKTPNGRRILHR
ncbi:MAG: S8 family serine peptidase [Thermoanaerobaculia bacterium]